MTGAEELTWQRFLNNFENRVDKSNNCSGCRIKGNIEFAEVIAVWDWRIKVIWIFKVAFRAVLIKVKTVWKWRVEIMEIFKLTLRTELVKVTTVCDWSVKVTGTYKLSFRLKLIQVTVCGCSILSQVYAVARTFACQPRGHWFISPSRQISKN